MLEPHFFFVVVVTLW